LTLKKNDDLDLKLIDFAKLAEHIENEFLKTNFWTFIICELYSLDKAQKNKKMVLGMPKMLFKPFLALGKQLISSFRVLGLMMENKIFV